MFDGEVGRETKSGDIHMSIKITFKQAVAKTLERHRIKVDNLFSKSGKNTIVPECGFCEYDDDRTSFTEACCSNCPTFVVEGKTCDALSVGVSNSTLGFCSLENASSDTKLTNVLARMMYLHTFSIDSFGTFYDSSEEDIIEEVME